MQKVENIFKLIINSRKYIYKVVISPLSEFHLFSAIPSSLFPSGVGRKARLSEMGAQNSVL